MADRTHSNFELDHTLRFMLVDEVSNVRRKQDVHASKKEHQHPLLCNLNSVSEPHNHLCCQLAQDTLQFAAPSTMVKVRQQAELFDGSVRYQNVYRTFLYIMCTMHFGIVSLLIFIL